MADTDADLSLSTLGIDKFEGQVLSLINHHLPGLLRTLFKMDIIALGAALLVDEEKLK